MPTTILDRAISFIVAHEGGTSSHPADRGKLTRFGISQAAYPHLDIASLSLEDAKAIYRADYWKPIHGDQLPELVALATLDCAVNSGPERAIRCLQQAIGVKIDGQIGPKTLERLHTLRLGQLKVALDCIHHRVSFLVELVHKDSSQLVFLAGWMRRTHDLVSELYFV